MKKKIIIIAVSVIVLAMTIASATTAYFTDTDAVVNEFTVGNVDITLTETNTDYTGAAIEAVIENEETVYKFGRLYPGQTYTKLAVIENTGTENAYLAARITLTSANLDARFLENGAVKESAVRYFLQGLVSGDEYIVTFDAVENEANKIIIRVIKKTATTIPTAEGVKEGFTLVNNVYVDPAWGNTEMADLANLSIKVEAYGVQTVGFTSAEEAVTTAFKTDFPSANN